MATLNVYVPDDLKAKVAEHPEINWSRIARAAFERALLVQETGARWFPTEADVKLVVDRANQPPEERRAQ